MKLYMNTHIKDYEQGQEYEVDKDEAKRLVDNGYAKPVKTASKSKPKEKK